MISSRCSNDFSIRLAAAVADALGASARSRVAVCADLLLVLGVPAAHRDLADLVGGGQVGLELDQRPAVVELVGGPRDAGRRAEVRAAGAGSSPSSTNRS